jgi:holo-[acyl-carrier protein] synthase
MIIGLGVDVFEVSRMERALREGDPGLTRDLFTLREIADCERQSDPIPQFAARFALKEAVLKALSIADDGSPRWRDIELLTGDDGVATLTLGGALEAQARQRGVVRVFHSLSHTRGLVVARAILESDHD